MTYNSKVLLEQGGSVLRVDSGGSISLQDGGTISGAGTIQSTGDVTLAGLLTATGGVTTTSEVTATSITVLTGGAFYLGSNIQLRFTAGGAPSDAPVQNDIPGTVLFRSAGANSEGYINTCDASGAGTGSVWTAFNDL